MRAFREGTRGALKIVYWSNIEKISSTTFQERLFKKIEIGAQKTDFSPFDIYQYVDEPKKEIIIADLEKEPKTENLNKFLRQTKKELFAFSGNLSWINKKNVAEAIEELLEHNVTIKILSRVDIASIKNIQKILAIEEKVGKKLIEIRHCSQPLRGFILDDSTAQFNEEKKPEIYKPGELEKELLITYRIRDEEWVGWLQKIFWNLFRTSISAEKRLKDIEKMNKAIKKS